MKKRGIGFPIPLWLMQGARAIRLLRKVELAQDAQLPFPPLA